MAIPARITSTQSSFENKNYFNISQKSSSSALFHMKTLDCLKYHLNDCEL